MSFKVVRSFRPTVTGTIVLLLVATLFASLGIWQTNRAAEKLVTEQQHRAAQNVSIELALAENQRFAHVEVSGHYDPVRHILLDNQIWKGRAGVHVYTPFFTSGGIAILVNRGWLPLDADRKSLPGIPTPKRETVLRGILNQFPVPGRLMGQADKLSRDHWPQLVTYLNHDDLARSLETPLENWIIQLSGSEKDGFEGREWKPVYMSSGRHRAYAFQWFALATASIVLWLITGFRKSSGK